MGRDSKKPTNWLSWMTRNPGDIYVLIDTILSRETELFLKSRWKGKIYCNTLPSNAWGTAILVRKETNIKNCDFNIIDKGNFSTFSFFYNKIYAFNALWGPTNDSPLY